MSSCFGKKKPTQVVSKKIDGYYEKFHSINFELDGILEFNKAAIPNQRRNGIINDFFFFQEHISYLIETVNRIEESLGLRKLEFDVRRIWPVRSTNRSYLLEKCHHIESFLCTFDLSIIKITLKKSYQVQGNMEATFGIE